MADVIQDFFIQAVWALPLLLMGAACIWLGIKKRDDFPRQSRLAFWSGVLIICRVMVVGPAVMFWSTQGFVMTALAHLVAALILATAFGLLLWAAFPVKPRVLAKLPRVKLPKFSRLPRFRLGSNKDDTSSDKPLKPA
ncbi:MAG: hypothetical protein AAF585_15440 [Verrucomicrobiota bacterium]